MKEVEKVYLVVLIGLLLPIVVRGDGAADRECSLRIGELVATLGTGELPSRPDSLTVLLASGKNILDMGSWEVC